MADLDLVASTGPLEGTRFRLRRDEPLLLGRSSRGVHLADPKVSVQHAQIEFVAGRYVVTDLGSSTGTFVGGAQLEASKPTPIDVGSALRVGDSEFKVVRAGGSSWVRGLAAGVFGVLAIGIAGALAWLAFAAKEGGTVLAWPTGIRTGTGVAVAQVLVPPDFLRRHGLGPGSLAIDRVGDDDANDIDEVWLSSADAQFVVTFDESSTWLQLGELPLGCVRSKTAYDDARGVAPELPVVRCGGETWMVDRGRYDLVAHDGPVVWVDPRTAVKPALPAVGKAKTAPAPPAAPSAPPPPPPADKAKPGLEVVRIRMAKPERVAAFLASRGITEPVHYLICEGALDGIAAQARAASGRLVHLTPGCLGEVLFDGQKLGSVAMVAFSAVGRRALLDDLASTWGGSPEGLWLGPEDAKRLRELSVEPGVPRGSSLLTAFRVDGELPWRAPPEVPLGDRVRLISNVAGAPPQRPPAVVRTLTEAGDQVIDPPGCAKYLLTVSPFTCRLTAGCLPNATFLRLVEVGCGEPTPALEVPYEAGVYDVAAPTVMRTRIATRKLPDGVEVTRADIGWVPISDPP